MNIAFKLRNTKGNLKCWRLETHTGKSGLPSYPYPLLVGFCPNFPTTSLSFLILFSSQKTQGECLSSPMLVSYFLLQASLGPLGPPPIWTFSHIPYKRRTLLRCWVSLLLRDGNWLHPKLLMLQHCRGPAQGHCGGGTCCPCLRPVAHRANRTGTSPNRLNDC